MTQRDRLIELLSERDMTSLELTMAGVGVNVTGRISDARKAGHHIDVYRDQRGNFRYHLVRVTKGEPIELGLGAA